MHFLKNISKKIGKAFTGFHSNAMKKLCLHTWPGNIRELENVIEYACVVGSGKIILEENIQLHKSVDTNEDHSYSMDTKSPVFAAEKKLIAETLRRAGGNQQKAAKMLGISRVTLWRKMKKLMMK